MGKKRELVPAEKLDLSTVKYEPELLQAPHLTGLTFKLFVGILELPVIGPLIVSQIKKQNKMVELLRNTVVPEKPMYRPEFPPQEKEPGVVDVDEEGNPEDRVETALTCLPHCDPASFANGDLTSPFKYWTIRDYAHAYRTKLTTPSSVAENIISVIEQLKKEKPKEPFLISFDAELVRKQAAASTDRFEKENPISILDGIFMAIKDDIDCYPHPTKGATTWMHETRHVEKDAVCVSRLRRCGVIFLGKANMHELGMGTTGNNPNYGTTRNPHGVERYTGGSSSAPAALVASGLCSATLGTDGGGSVRIPSSLCGVVGLKTTFGRTNLEGSLPETGTVTIIGPIASSVEDVMLIYATMLGSSPEDKISLKPSPPCLPNLSSHESMNLVSSMRLGKYAAWFNDVHTTVVSDRCDDILNLLTRTHGCEIVEIVVPDLEEMRLAHLISIGSEMLGALYPDIADGKGKKLTYDSRTSNALFESFSASDYLTAQRLRRRLMYHHMEIFKKVDVIVTPTTGMTAPKIPSSAIKYGETDMQVTGYLMRFVIAANLLGLPAITIPVGYDKEGMPIGLQLIGRPWGEATLLRLAYAVEELCAKPKKKPESFYNILKIKSNI